MPSIRSLTVALFATCLLSTTALASVFQRPLSSGCNCKAKSWSVKPKDFVTRYDNLTAQFTDLAGPTKEVTARNAFLVVANEGPLPIVLLKLVSAVNSAQEFLDDLGDEPGSIKKGQDNDDVLEAYRSVTKAVLFWASILSSKSNGFKGAYYKPVGALIESGLLAVQDLFESHGFLLTDYLEDSLADVQEQTASLGKGLNTAIAQYSAIKLGNA